MRRARGATPRRGLVLRVTAGSECDHDAQDPCSDRVGAAAFAVLILGVCSNLILLEPSRRPPTPGHSGWLPGSRAVEPGGQGSEHPGGYFPPGGCRGPEPSWRPEDSPTKRDWSRANRLRQPAPGTTPARGRRRTTRTCADRSRDFHPDSVVVSRPALAWSKKFNSTNSGADRARTVVAVRSRVRREPARCLVSVLSQRSDAGERRLPLVVRASGACGLGFCFT